jgi:hypothetical protein
VNHRQIAKGWDYFLGVAAGCNETVRRLEKAEAVCMSQQVTFRLLFSHGLH